MDLPSDITTDNFAVPSEETSRADPSAVDNSPSETSYERTSNSFDSESYLNLVPIQLNQSWRLLAPGLQSHTVLHLYFGKLFVDCGLCRFRLEIRNGLNAIITLSRENNIKFAVWFGICHQMLLHNERRYMFLLGILNSMIQLIANVPVPSVEATVATPSVVDWTCPSTLNDSRRMVLVPVTVNCWLMHCPGWLSLGYAVISCHVPANCNEGARLITQIKLKSHDTSLTHVVNVEARYCCNIVVALSREHHWYSGLRVREVETAFRTLVT
ncbi:hypothetical protein HW555_012605 [Spodoptera exigua]|uniref:Uncharacterized protein n=1 Tax=Spodoptera exigua TaxID=7107 RepID=A0A835G572_SPOEX|nr:hypothetical protein HW555_012605 [Spodoptera exigua]